MATAFKFGDYEPEEEIITNRKNGENYVTHKYKFKNGRGAIVAQNNAYREAGLYSLLPVEFDKSTGRMILLSSITNDLTSKEIKKELGRIEGM